MPKRKTSRRVRKVLGVIHAAAMYTTDGAMRYGGLGWKSLADARSRGFVESIEQGNRLWFEGRQLLDYIRSHKKS